MSLTFNEMVDAIARAARSGHWWVFPASQISTLAVLKCIQDDYYNENDEENFGLFDFQKHAVEFRAVFVAHKSKMSPEQLINALSKYAGTSAETAKITPECMANFSLVAVFLDEIPAVSSLSDTLRAWDARN